MGPGEYIKALREERGLRPADVERLSQRLADDLRNPDYVIPHATLNGIESGSTPTIFKLAALAAVLAVRVEHLLLLYGIDITQRTDRGETGVRIESAEQKSTVLLRGVLSVQTQLVPSDHPILRSLPAGLQTRLGPPHRFSYALIGTKDDILWDVLPGGSFVEIDRNQNAVTRFSWTSLSQRPIYCLWHGEGHVCCWCDQTGNVITIVPHPLSRQRSRQLRAPREVSVIGRVTNSWQLGTLQN